MKKHPRTLFLLLAWCCVALVSWQSVRADRDLLIQIPAGTAELEVVVQPKADPVLEESETVLASLEKDLSYGITYQAQAELRIHDAGAPPDITGFSPQAAPVGATVVIRGHGFVDVSVVSFNGTPAVFTVDSPTQITVVVPQGASTGPLAIGAAGGAVTSLNDFRLLVPGNEWDRTWYPRDTGDNSFRLNAVTYADGLFVAVGEGGRITTSVDGIRWKDQSPVTGMQLFGIAAGSIGGKNYFVAAGGGVNRDAGGVILTSVDGLNWSVNPVDRPVFCVAYGNGAFLVGGVFRVFRTTDVKNWEKRETPRQDGWRETAVSLAFGNGRFVMTTALAHHDGRGHRLIFTSDNGIDWTRRINRLGEWWYRYSSIGFSPELGFLIVGHHSNDPDGRYCGDDDDCYNEPHFWNEQAFDNNSGGWAHTSVDGAIWIERSKPTQRGMFGLTSGDGVFVAVGNQGMAQITSDGLVWQEVNTGTGERLRGATYGAGLFVAVGNKGVIVRSRDAISWSTSQPSSTQPPAYTRPTLRGLASKEGLSVAVGDGGTLLTSTDRKMWKPVRWGVEFIPGTFTWAQAKADAVSRGGRLARSIPIQFVQGSFTWLEAFNEAEKRGGTLAYWSDDDQLKRVQSVNAGKDTHFNAQDIGHEGVWTAKVPGQEFNFPGALPWQPGEPQGGLGEGRALFCCGNNNIADINEGQRANFVMITGSGWFNSGWLAGSDQGGEGNWRWDGTTETLANLPWAAGQPDGGTAENFMFWNGSKLEDRPGSLTAGYFIEYPDHQLDSQPLYAVAYGSGKFVAVGENRLYVSSNPQIWKRPADTDFPWRRVRFLNGNFIAVGGSGKILTSPDGTTWTARNSGVTTELRDVAYGDGRYVVAGFGGTLLSSTDLVTWEKFNSGNANNLYGVAFGNGTFLAVGDGIAWTSSNGLLWRLRGQTGRSFRTLEFGNSQFLASSENTPKSGFLRTLDGVTWSEVPTGYGVQFNVYAIEIGSTTVTLAGEYSTILESVPYGLLSAVSVTRLQDASEVGPTAGKFLLKRTGDLTKPLTVKLKIGGSATEPDDYQLVVPNVP
jgi:hypothetical protein